MLNPHNDNQASAAARTAERTVAELRLDAEHREELYQRKIAALHALTAVLLVAAALCWLRWPPLRRRRGPPAWW